MRVSLFQGIVLAVFILAAVIGVLVFSLRGPGNPNTKDTIGNVVIWGVLPREEVEKGLAVARVKDPNMKGVTYIEKDPLTLENELIAAIAKNKSPDLVLISQEDLSTLAPFIKPISSNTLSERSFKDAFVSGGEVYLAPDGSGTAGVPYLVDPLVLFQNRSILASSGVATAPSTWEALTGLVPRITTKTASGNIARALIALGTYGNVHNARGILSMFFLQAGVPISSISANGYRTANLGTSQAQGMSLGEAVLRFYTQFADASKVSYTWNASLPDSQSRFLTGDLALYLGYASEAAYFTQANPNLDFDVARIPQRATSNFKSTYGLVYAFVIPNGSTNAAGAYKAAVALVDPNAEQAVALAARMAPADRVLLASPPSETTAAVAYEEALYAKGWLSPAPADTDSVFSNMISNVISGRLTIGAALTLAEGALTDLLQR